MLDNQETIFQFVTIIERFPEIYDSTNDSYKEKHALYKAWEKVAACVREEIKTECTVNELQKKWKGIRSSFTRFKSNQNRCKKYYLYDALRFLEPFVKLKSKPQGENQTEIDESEESIEFQEVWEEHEIKPDLETFNMNREPTTSSDNFQDFSDTEMEMYNPSKAKRKKSNENPPETNTVGDNDDNMQFFKSILPDLKDFTAKEKRKFKMGVLKLIDEIEERRKITKDNVASTS